jgi:outer membrane cobalamin receptor
MTAASIALFALLLQAPAEAIRGTVSAADGRPLEGVLVAIAHSPALAVTDDQGGFVLTPAATDHPPFTITASLPGYRHVEVAAPAGGQPLRIVLAGAQPTFTSSVTVNATAADPAAASRLSFSPLDVVRTAGTQADVMRELATLPGVTTIDGGTGLFVRGGDVSEVQVLFDGVVVNHPYRNETPSGGFRGAVDTFMTKETTFTTGGFASPYGDALSGVVDFTPQDRPAARQMTATIGLAGLSLSAARPIGTNGGLRIAVNRATPAVLFAVNPSAEPFDEYPGGWEASAAAYRNSRTFGDLRMFVLHQTDHIGVRIERDAFTGFLHANTTHSFAAAHWQKAVAPRWLASASGGTDRYTSSQDAGVMRLASGDVNYSGRVDLSGSLGDWRVRTGETVQVDRPDTSGTVPIVGGDLSGTAGIKAFTVTRQTWTAGTFADVTRTFGRVTPELGVRADYYNSDQAWTLDPRAAVVLGITPRQRLRFAFGHYHQSPPVPYFDRTSGNPLLPPEEATHAIAGYEIGAPASSSFFRVEAYTKKYTNLPLQSGDGFDASGYGSAHGVDVYVTHAWPIVTLRANASWLAATRRWTPWDQRNTYPLPPAGTWPPDFDIPYSFEVVSTIRAPHQIAIDTAWRTTAGRPFTPALGATAVDDGYLPVWGDINSQRLPRYERLDVSLTRNVRVASRPAIVFLSVGNVFDRRNVSAYSYSPDYSVRTTVPGGSPRTIYVGITIR